jgi:hypothetical protein
MFNKTKNGIQFDSFDRFGDDLCEVLISYLSISDKIGFECVSKQWKSLIFNKQKSIEVNFAKKVMTQLNCRQILPQIKQYSKNCSKV